MKKRLVVLLVVVALVFAACGGGGGSGSEIPTINLYSGGSDNVRLSWEAAIAAFHATDPGINVVLQFIPSDMGNVSDNFIASVRAGVEEIDMNLIDLGEHELMRILDAAGPEALAPITVDQVPNLSHVTGTLTFGQGMALGYRGTTVVLAYDSARVPNPPRTADELHDWIRANPGRFAYNDPTTGGAGGAFVRTTVYNEMPNESEQSSDPRWRDYWDAGIEVLAALHPYMYQTSGGVLYPARNQGTIDLMVNGEVDIVPAWADMALSQIAHGILPDTTRITQISPPLTGNLQILAMPANTANHDAVYEFLNFVVSPEAQALFVTEMHAIPVIPNEMLPTEVVDLLAGFAFTDYRIISIGDLSTYLDERWLMEIATLP